MRSSRLDRLRPAARLSLAVIYLAAGALHLADAKGFAVIVPPVVPHPVAVVLFTGGCEIAGALGLMLPATRRLAGAMLALYALCVWPANIYQAFWHIPAPPLPDSWWYHAPRLALQPVIIAWALFAGGVPPWPRPAKAVPPRPACRSATPAPAAGAYSAARTRTAPGSAR